MPKVAYICFRYQKQIYKKIRFDTMATKMIGNTEVEIKYWINPKTGEKTEYSDFDYWVESEKQSPVNLGFAPLTNENNY